MARILLIEDDPSIVESLRLLLMQNGFEVLTGSRQSEALALLDTGAFDLMLLDLALPDGHGFAVCAAAKRLTPDLPVIFLTASDDEMSVVAGLDMGADDYISKPFRPMELISRIRTALRKHGATQSVFELSDVRLDSIRGKVTKGGQEVFLSALEYRLLLTFLSRKGEMLTRDMLLNALWDAAGDFVTDNTLTVYIKRLREKIEDNPQNPQIIRTVRGIGYKAGD